MHDKACARAFSLVETVSLSSFVLCSKSPRRIGAPRTLPVPLAQKSAYAILWRFAEVPRSASFRRADSELLATKSFSSMISIPPISSSDSL